MPTRNPSLEDAQASQPSRPVAADLERSARDRLLAALSRKPRLDEEDGGLIDHVVREAREESIAGQLSP